MSLNLWFGGPPKISCGPCRGSGVGYACPCFKCDGRGWKYKEKPEEARYQVQLRWRRKVDNYLELEIGEALSVVHDIVNDPPGCLPGEIQASADQDWSAKIDEAIEKFRGLVERRGKYVTIRRLVDVTCERCAKGEERDEQGHHTVTCGVGDPALPMKVGALRCLASGLWEELAKVEKENTDVD